jgi:hypothetical protein
MSRLSGDSYSISRPTGRCAHTGEELRPGDHYVAALVERDGEEGFERLDYGAGAWDGGARPERLFGFWRATMPDADAKPRMFIDDDGLLALWEGLVEDESGDENDAQKREAFRWILTLILLRRRLLKQVGASVRDGRRVLQVRPKGTPPEATPLEVADPGMNEGAATAAAEQLSAVMRGES